MKWFALCAALLAYLALHMGFESAIHNPVYRPTVWETDDNLHYMVKTPLEDTCPQGQCLALQSLWQQTSVALPNDAPAALRFAQTSIQHRTMLIYHPLYSWALGILNDHGIPLEQGQYLLNMLGHMVAAMAIALFAGCWFGWPTAILTLIVATPLWFFPGLTIMKPGTLSSAASLLGMAFLARPTPVNLAVSLVMMAVATGLHAVGGVFAVIGAGIFVLSHPAFTLTRPASWFRPSFVLYGVGAVALCLYATAGMGSLAPQELSHLAYHAPSLAAMVKGNMKMLVTLLTPLSAQVGLGFLLVGALAGPFMLPRPQRRWVAVVSGVTALLMVASIAYPSPEASLLERLWPVLTMMLLAQACAVLVQMAAMVPWRDVTARLWARKTLTPAATVPAAVTSAFAILLLWGMVQGVGTHLTAIQFIRTHKNVYFPPQVIQQAVQATPADSSILFHLTPLREANAQELQEAALYAALDYGAASRALQVDAFAPLPQSPATALLLHPFVQTTGNDPLPGVAAVGLEASTTLALHMTNPGPAVTVQAGGQTLNVPANTDQWFELAPALHGRLDVRTSSPAVRLTGWKTTATQATRWPWESGASIHTADAMAVPLTLKDMLPAGCRVTDVLNDSSSLVALRLACTR